MTLSEQAAGPEADEVFDLFDPAETLDRVCDDVELLSELAVLFAGHRDQLLAELDRAAADGDASGIGRAAHGLKGSLSTFTTKRPFRIARELELSGTEGRLEPAPRLLAELKADLIRLEGAIAELVNSHG